MGWIQSQDLSAVQFLLLASSSTVGYQAFGDFDGDAFREDFAMRFLRNRPASICVGTKVAGPTKTRMTTPAFVDPDHQPPIPFQAAEDYAVAVMTRARETLPDDIVVASGLVYGTDRLQRYDLYAPRGVRNATALVFWHGGRDSERVMRSNRRLRALLQLQQGPVRHVVHSGRDHFQTHSDLRQADHAWYASLRRLVASGQP